MSLFGPTKPLQPQAPLPRDIVESDALVAFVSSVTAPNVARQTLDLIETLAVVMVRTVAASLNNQQGGRGGLDEEAGVSFPAPANSSETDSNQGLHSLPIWARAMAFGSTGIDANVKSRDVDVYVG